MCSAELSMKKVGCACQMLLRTEKCMMGLEIPQNRGASLPTRLVQKLLRHMHFNMQSLG